MPTADLNREFSSLERQAAKDFRSEGWEGRAIYSRSVDVRYRGQGYELNVPANANLIEAFKKEHKRRYGYTHPNREIEMVTLRLRAIVKTPQRELTTTHVGTGALMSLPRAKPRGPGRAKLGSGSPLEVPVQFDTKKLQTKVYSREELHSGKKYSGPAIITEYSATSVIPPSKNFHLDRAANLIVTIR